MTDTLQVRVYNVRFGDAILASIPDLKADGTTTVHHILIDFGNALSTMGGDDAVFGPVARDILHVLNGQGVDLYVMTHEHLDHVQGLKYAAEQLQLPIPVTRAWLTASAEPGYYDSHENSKKRRLEAREAYLQMRRFLAAAPEQNNQYLEILLANNDVMLRGDVPVGEGSLAASSGTSNTADCVEFIRSAGGLAPTYVHRELDLTGLHPFEEARLSVLAPEEETSIYYGRFQPMAFGEPTPGAPEAGPAVPLPPQGVDAGAFYDLVEARRRGFQDNLLAIDAANNNTSVVLFIEWRGWRLLFPGDAEVRSWKEMSKRGLLQPVHFLKVGHHGSENGTPPPPLLDTLLPPASPDGRPRRAVVSTFEGSYPGVPDGETLKRIESRVDQCESTEGLSDGEPILFEFS